MMMGAKNRTDIYKGIDRVNANIDMNMISDILAQSDIDFDNPSTFGPVMQQLDQIKPKLGAEVGKMLYDISNSRMKAAAAAAMNLSHGKAYLGQANEFNAQAGRINTGVGMVNKAVDAGTPQLAGGDVLLGNTGNLPQTSTEQNAQAFGVADRTLEGAKYAADQKLKGTKYTADTKVGGGSGSKFRLPSTKDSKPMMATGVSFFRSKYPNANFTDAEGNMSDWAAVIILDAYQRGEAIAREENIPVRTMQDIFDLGFQDMEGNISEMTAPDNQGTVLTLSRGTTNMPVQAGGQMPPPPQPSLAAQQPDNGNYPSVFNQQPTDKVITATAEFIKKNPNVPIKQIVLGMMNQYKAMGLSREETKVRINAFINQR